MQYVLLIYGDPAAAEGMSEEDGRAMMAEYFEYTEGLRRSGAYVSGEPLESAQTATTVRQRDGQQNARVEEFVHVSSANRAAISYARTGGSS